MISHSGWDGMQGRLCMQVTVRLQWRPICRPHTCWGQEEPKVAQVDVRAVDIVAPEYSNV